MNVHHKTAIVTGGGQGIGRAIAMRLYESRANVVVNYFPDSAENNRAIAESTVQEFGDRAIAIAADVRDPEQVSKLFDQSAERFGSVDILVNNAGILRDRSIKNMTDDEWRDVIDTNLTGVFNCCRAAARKLSDYGRIINIASLSAATGFFGQANYAAAKAGVISLTKVLSKELALRNILVNAIAPGVIMTEMGESIPESNRAAMLQQIPLNRFGESDEVAKVALFLASDLSSYMTGQTLHVNGGWWG